MAFKVSIAGAGAVGSTLGMRISEADLADVVLLDIAKGVACGKALDLSDAAYIMGHEKRISGTDNYEDTRGSDIVVITAGFARRLGMTREELISKNASIVKDVSLNIKRHAPSSIIIVVTNPLDAMTYLALKTTGFKRQRVFGMAGVLDGSRFIELLAEELNAPRSALKTFVMGSHGDTMVPVISQTLLSGKPVRNLISDERLRTIIDRARNRGAEVVSLLGNGSAYYSPSAAVFRMVKAVLSDTKEILAASAYLTGEYGLNDICIGVPCAIGRRGIERIVELKLDAEEKKALSKSSKAIKSSIELLKAL